MNPYYRYNGWIIWLSFIIAIILQIIPCWPLQFYLFRPSWLSLLLIYWVIELPHRINIGTGFMLGLIMDLILGSTLCIHALALSVLSYLVSFKFQLLNKLALWQQVFIVILISLAAKMVIFLVEFMLISLSFRKEIFLSSLIDGILWPWLFLIMNKISRQFIIQWR